MSSLELVATQRDRILPLMIDHVHAFHSVRRLPFGWRKDIFQPDDDKIPDDEDPHVVQAVAHEFLLELDD